MSVHVGKTFPQGHLTTTHGSGESFSLDLEFPISTDFSIVAIAGYNGFSGTSGGSDTHVFNLSANAKYDLVSGALDFWIGGGAGAYFPEGGSTSAGVNASVGVTKAISPNLDFDAAVDYHLAFTSGNNTEFMVARAGLIFWF